LSYGYLASCTVDRGVLVGQAYTAGGIDFTNGVVVMDHLENVNSSPSNTLNVDGLLDNRGTICNGSYGVIVNLSGDLRNEGDICCSMVALDFGEHHVTMGPDGDCGALVFLPEFQGGTIYVDSDARFTRGVGLGGGQMVLAPGVTVEFSMHSGVTTGTVIGNGGTLVLLDYAAVSALTIDSAVLSGKFDVSNEIQLTGNVRATGILENREFLPASISIDGTFRNEGTIRDNNAALSIVASGDLENAGTWTNSSVVLSGTQDQRVGIGPGIDVPSFVLDSGLLGASYQWLKNGSPIAGANGSTLSFAGLGAADYGTYRCQVDGGSLSRTFELEEGTDPASAPGSGPQGSAALSRVFPNPFTRSTTIGFELAETSPVHLSIHDVTGREIEVLVDGLMTQGPHEVVWSPIADDSGVFYYRLVTAGDVRTGRCLRLGTGRSSR
ncbi:MAG: hypothetical protein KC729_04810, partial [Candidatus Eisenbacteria bacterium]|nr:hypothetical protein [Candidatus Eisenbacteria bacterium]